MSLVELSIRRPVTVFIGAVAAVVFGVVAFRGLATDLLPDISYPSITVRTGYEGGAPLEVENLVTRPVENAVGVVSNVARVNSSSRADISEVTLEFNWGTRMDLAALDVRERLDMLALPVDAERPILLRYDPALDPILRLGLSGADDLVRLRLIGEEQAKRALERIEGVAAVVVSGGLEEEVQVEIDERRLANLGLTVDRVRERLARENVNLTAGRLREGRTEYLVRTVNEVLRPEELMPIVIAADEGALIRLSDVARVVRGHKEREIITRINGRESVEVAVYKEGGTNTVRVSDRVREQLDVLEQRLRQLDPGLDVTLISDQARYIRESVSEVLRTALFGGLLAILVLYLFLRSVKPTLIIGIAIPVSVIATFFLMMLSDISLNIMSLGGLTLGIGLLVDNSIVVLESIQRRRDAGLDDVEAARQGAGEVGRAVTASTLTTICVFVPIVFVEGVAGQLFGDQALTVTYSLLISLLVAMTVIPMLASGRLTANPQPADEEPAGIVARLLVAAIRPVAATAGLVARLVGRAVGVPLAGFAWLLDRAAAGYDRLLGAALRRPALVVLVALLLLAASLIAFPRFGRELVPELTQGEFFVDVELPAGTHLDVTQRRLARIESTAGTLDGVDTVYSISGSSNEQGGISGELRENVGQINLGLAPPISRQREDAMIARLRESLSFERDLDYRFGRPSYFSFRTPVEVELRGHNLLLIERFGDRLAEQMRTIPGLADVKSSTEGGNPELQVRFDRERLASLGLSLADAAEVVRAKVQGTIATDLQREDRSVDIRVRSAEGFRDSVADLERLTVLQAGKTSVPLAAVASIEEVEGPAEIRRADGERVAVISANLDGTDLGTVSARIAEALDSLALPGGIGASIGGQRQEMQTSFGSMRLAIFLAVFMVYLVMASQFESLLHPLVILFSIPFALIGIALTLAISGVAISVVVLIGGILLAGIVVNNAILLVDATNRLRREGLEKVAAVRRAAQLRFRPILMTTATTVLGLLPMALAAGAGNELRQPMALTVCGGLLSSTLLTLLLLPAVYCLLDRRR